MITVTKWKIVITKDGVPAIIQRNDKYFCDQRIKLKSEDIIFTEEGIEYDRTSHICKDAVTHYKCPYSSLAYKAAPSPLSFREKLGDAKVQGHVLCFLYELISGVLISDERYSFIKDREPIDIAALLAKYSEFSGQLGGIDWEKIASQIKICDEVLV